MERTGSLVKLADGRIGRTYKDVAHRDEQIPVFLSTNKDHTQFREKPIFVHPDNVDILDQVI